MAAAWCSKSPSLGHVCVSGHIEQVAVVVVVALLGQPRALRARELADGDEQQQEHLLLGSLLYLLATFSALGSC